MALDIVMMSVYPSLAHCVQQRNAYRRSQRSQPQHSLRFIRIEKGGVSLTRDDGINLGIDYNLTRSLDFSAGYSRSVYGVLNTFSFGIGVNVSSLLKRSSKE